MRRLTLLPLMASLAALLLAGTLACTPETPAPAGGQGTPAPKEEAPAPTEEATPAPEEAAPADPATTSPDDLAPTEGTATDGAVTTTFDSANFYAMNCSGCHGPQGEGSDKGPAYSKVLHEPEEELIDAVINGKEGKMPAFKDKLSAEEAKVLVAWLHAQFGAAAAAPEGHSADDGHGH